MRHVSHVSRLDAEIVRAGRLMHRCHFVASSRTKTSASADISSREMSLVDTPAPTSSTEPSASSSSSSDRSDSSAAAPISDVGIDVPLKEV